MLCHHCNMMGQVDSQEVQAYEQRAARRHQEEEQLAQHRAQEQRLSAMMLEVEQQQAMLLQREEHVRSEALAQQQQAVNAPRLHAELQAAQNQMAFRQAMAEEEAAQHMSQLRSGQPVSLPSGHSPSGLGRQIHLAGPDSEDELHLPQA